MSAQYCTFHVAGLFLGIDVLSVQEVLRATHELARVPLAPPTVEGLLNLRGQIVTTIDLRRRLGFAPGRPEDDRMIMIIRAVDGQVALIVDAVGDVIDVEEKTFETPPATLSAAARALIGGVHKLPGRLLHLLDAELAVSPQPHAV